MGKRETKRRGRGESAVYQKTRRWKSGDGYKEKVYWVAAVSEGHDRKTGKRVRKYIYCDTKAEAQSQLVNYVAKHGGTIPTAHDRPTLTTFVSTFLEDVRANRSANTARSYEMVLRLHTFRASAAAGSINWTRGLSSGSTPSCGKRNCRRVRRRACTSRYGASSTLRRSAGF